MAFVYLVVSSNTSAPRWPAARALIRVVETEPFPQPLQVTPLILRKFVAPMAPYLHLGGETLDGDPGSGALAGQVLPIEYRSLGLPDLHAVIQRPLVDADDLLSANHIAS